MAILDQAAVHIPSVGSPFCVSCRTDWHRQDALTKMEGANCIIDPRISSEPRADNGSPDFRYDPSINQFTTLATFNNRHS